MWICNRCQEKNREGDTRCIGCAAPRSARRFGASTQVPAPSIAEESAAPVAAPVQPHVPTGRQPQVDLAPPRRVVRCASGRWLSGLGMALCALLPLLLVYLTIRHFDDISTFAASLVLPVGEGETPDMLQRIVSLVALGVPALLVATLPGLSALGLGRLLIRLTPPELRRDA